MSWILDKIKIWLLVMKKFGDLSVLKFYTICVNNNDVYGIHS